MSAGAQNLKQSFDFDRGELTVTLTPSNSGGDLILYLPETWYPKEPVAITIDGKEWRLSALTDGYFKVVLPASGKSKVDTYQFMIRQN
jgi:hypothetical protein